MVNEGWCIWLINIPYGTKTKEQVKGYVDNVIDILLEHNVNTIVIACNTATSIAVNELRRIHQIPIIGMEPAVKPAIEKNNDGRKNINTNVLLKT